MMKICDETRLLIIAYYYFFFSFSNFLQQFAQSFDIQFIETSAKNSHNVNQCFVQMATAIKNRMTSTNTGSSGGQKIQEKSGEKKRGRC